MPLGKKHVISLSYEESFNEKDNPIKARSYQMNQECLELCKKRDQGSLKEKK